MEAKDLALVVSAFTGLIAAVFSGIAAVYAARASTGTDRNTRGMISMKQDVTEARDDIRTIEKATNSMKDQLVAATGKAAHAAGLAEGKKEGPDSVRPSGNPEIVSAERLDVLIERKDKG